MTQWHSLPTAVPQRPVKLLISWKLFFLHKYRADTDFKYRYRYR